MNAYALLLFEQSCSYRKWINTNEIPIRVKQFTELTSNFPADLTPLALIINTKAFHYFIPSTVIMPSCSHSVKLFILFRLHVLYSHCSCCVVTQSAWPWIKNPVFHSDIFPLCWSHEACWSVVLNSVHFFSTHFTFFLWVWSPREENVIYSFTPQGTWRQKCFAVIQWISQGRLGLIKQQSICTK